jgi:hypothetical protein
MANEISQTVSYTATKNSVTISGGTTKTSDMTGNRLVSMVIAVSSTYEALSAGVLAEFSTTPPGELYIRNIDASNTLMVSLTNASASNFAVILPGKQSHIQPAAISVYVAFSTGTGGLAHVAANEA